MSPFYLLFPITFAVGALVEYLRGKRTNALISAVLAVVTLIVWVLW